MLQSDFLKKSLFILGSTLPTSLRSVCSILHYLSVCITAVSAGGERLGESFLRKTKGWAVRSKSDIYSLGQGLHWVTYDVVESQHFMTYCLDRDIQRKSMQESIVVQVLSTIILVQYKGGIPSFLSQNIGTFDTKISTKSKCANEAPRYQYHSAVSQLSKRKIVFVIQQNGQNCLGPAISNELTQMLPSL